MIIVINRWLITGDTHGEFSRFKNYEEEIKHDPNTAIIILGDAALNWTLNEQDAHVKDFLNKHYDFTIYCVRGNHEARPQNVPGMKLIYDENVQGEVYIQDEWPKIRYFKDFGIYIINGFKVAVIGGAYSVDKWYRIEMNYIWYEDELLTTDEMLECTKEFSNEEVDFVFTHTCPICWEPTDLFMREIDQNTVDKSMELFLDEIAKCFKGKIWLFGHFHHDRLERPGVEQFYRATENIRSIWNRWYNYWRDGKFDWWVVKSPMFYMEDELLKERDEKWDDSLD